MFELPTINDLAERSRSAFRRNLKGSDAWIWPNNIYATAKVIAGMTFEIFGFASYISRQKFAHTAPDIESLRLHGEEFGIPQRPAAPASGTVRFIATDPMEIATGALLQRADGIQYLVISGGVLGGAGALDLPVVAVRDGASGNTVDGTPLAILSGLTGEALASAAGAIGLGTDVEDIEAYRARILFRKRNPPHGGSASDYVIWASQISGVSRVYVERLWAGAGTVRVLFMMDDFYADGIPQTADVIRVADYIETVRPAGARVSVQAPQPVPVDVTVTGLSPNTTAVREAVLAELRDTFQRLGRPAGIDTAHAGMPFLAVPTSFSRSWLWQAVANASGEERHVLTGPAADVTLSAGQIPVLGNVTFA